MSDILVVKLLNDSEILADVTNEVLPNSQHALTTAETGYYVLKNPCLVQFAPPAQGSHEARLALVPYLPYADGDTIRIKKDLVLFTFKPVLDIINRYNKIFGSGLILVDSAKIETLK